MITVLFWMCIALEIICIVLGDMPACFFYATVAILLSLFEEIQTLKGTFNVTLSEETKSYLKEAMHSWLNQTFRIGAGITDDEEASAEAARLSEADVTAVDERAAPH